MKKVNDSELRSIDAGYTYSKKCPCGKKITVTVPFKFMAYSAWLRKYYNHMASAH